MTARQFSEWEAYYGIEPFGDNMIDLRLASLQRDYTNVHRNTDNYREPFTIEDFAPYLEQKKKYIELTPEENGELIKAQLMALTRRQG